MMEWISVDDRLPESGEYVLRFGHDIITPEQPHYDVGQLVTKDGQRWADWGVTHWMPLPKPPIEEK